MATRALTAGNLTQAASSSPTALFFVEMDFLSGFVRLCTAAHAVTWNSFTWLGAGLVGAIEDLKETTGLQAVGQKFTLSGVDTAYISLVLSQRYQGRPVRVWLSFVTSSGLVADPMLIFTGRMDTMTIQDGPSSTITINAESRLADLRRPRMRRYTDADQQSEYPGDLGLQYVSEVSERQIFWGRS
jgi:hypothetical protein